VPKLKVQYPDKRKQKRHCEECGETHWPYVNCEYGAILNERDRIKAEAAERARVIPEFKTRLNSAPGDRMLTVRRIADNVFVKPGANDV
jgi:hypothetical protein